MTLKLLSGVGFRTSALIPNNAGAFPDLNEVDCLMYNSAYLQGSPPSPSNLHTIKSGAPHRVRPLSAICHIAHALHHSGSARFSWCTIV
jgi:hypothetical protein